MHKLITCVLCGEEIIRGWRSHLDFGVSVGLVHHRCAEIAIREKIERNAQKASIEAEMKNCKTRFSQCLDCNLHNKCQRYHEHWLDLNDKRPKV